MKTLTVLVLTAIGFAQIDLSVTQFSVAPATQVVTEGAISSFECQHSHADVITWTINETSVSSFVTPDVVSYTDGTLHTLLITARQAYNTSRVQCLAIYLNGQPAQLSAAAELIIQGTLNAVHHLSVIKSNLSILITWEAPFTLNITNTEPDITYCVNIRNISVNQDVISECNITQTEFLYTITRQVSCYHNDLDITVIPVNGAGHGVSEQTRFRYNDHKDLITISTEIIQISDERMELRLLTENDVTVCNCQLLLRKEATQYKFNTTNGLQCSSRMSYLSFSTDMLPFNDFYEGSFFITKNGVNINISTHDIHNIIVSGSDQNSVYLKVNYINGTKAKGAFVSFLPISKLQKPISLVIPYSQSFMLLTTVPFGAYRVLVYDLEREGHLMTPLAKPAVISTVAVLGSLTVDDAQNDNTEITVVTYLTHLMLTATCAYDQMSAADGCTIIVRSRDHPENLIVHIQQRESPKPLVYNVEAEINYTIAVFSTKSKSILNSTMSHSIEVFAEASATAVSDRLDLYEIASGVALSICVTIIIILLVVLILRAPCTTQCGCKKTRSNKIEMHACEAYETTQKYRPRNV